MTISDAAAARRKCQAEREGGGRMSKLSERAVMDLADNLTRKCRQHFADTVQLVDGRDPTQCMVIATQLAATGFGLAARLMQISAARKGLAFSWDECVDGIVGHVVKIARSNPPDEAAE